MPGAFDKGTLMEVSYNLTNEDIAAHNGLIKEARESMLLLDDTMLISGEVPRVTSYELGSPAECRKQADQWEKSPEVADRISPTIEDLGRLNPDYIITGHCTGARAQAELTAAFADRHISYGVGTVFNFTSSSI